MRYVCAYMLAQMGGNANPSETDIKAILGSVGVECDNARLSKGKKIDELIVNGSEKLASIPVGGGGNAAAPVAEAVAAPTAAAVVEKKEEVKEESDDDDDIGMGLFD